MLLIINVFSSNSGSSNTWAPFPNPEFRPAAFDAIAVTLPFGSVAFEAKRNERGERNWLEPHVVEKLRHLRGRARATAT
jgi:hypothetical protein